MAGRRAIVDKTFTLTVNGQTRTVTTDPERPLLEVLREDLRLTGTKYGCGQGQCGACTVLVAGKAVQSCITPVADVEGRAIVTIEGLAVDGQLHPVQDAFIAESAFQCGYCTPGMVTGAVALLNDTPNPTDAEIRAAMEKHICRCGGYPRIEKAIHRAANAGRQSP